VSAWSRRARRSEGQDISDDQSWSDAADAAHDTDTWHDPDPWDDVGVVEDRPPRLDPAPVRRRVAPAPESGPRRPPTPGRKGRLPKMAEERFRSGAGG
jgi:hypothetical protein